MRLFHTQGSPYARAVRIGVAWLGLADRVEEVETTLRDPSSTLLPWSPAGRVPALLLDDGATVLTETTLILLFLDRVAAPAGRGPLLPMDGRDGWRGLAAFGRVAGLMEGIAVWNRELRRPPEERSPSVIALETARAGRLAAALEREVAAGGFAPGTGVEAARILLACALGYGDRRHTVWRWREEHEALAAWATAFVEACGPVWEATMPPPSGI